MNDNQDYSSSSYSNDNDAFDMFSEIFDSSDRMDNYRSSYDNKNQMGRMSHFKKMFNKCCEKATNLPAEIAENSVITGETFGTVKLGEVKMFTKCCEKAKTKLCMHQDIKNKV